MATRDELMAELNASLAEVHEAWVAIFAAGSIDDEREVLLDLAQTRFEAAQTALGEYFRRDIAFGGEHSG
jgi:hypothetical protein